MGTTRSFLLALFFAMLLASNSVPVPAQTSVFVQTGRIRTIISETESTGQPLSRLMRAAGIRSVGGARSRIDHYFTYTASEIGVTAEKWIALPAGENWGRVADRPVRVHGTIRENKLLTADISPIGPPLNDTLGLPPPTIGTYKVVAVPLTIQPIPGVNAISETRTSSVTPEAIRDSLFNAPKSVNNFYLEASYGSLSFAGVHHPQVDVVPVTIQAAISANCQQQIIDEFTPVVRQRLLEQNINTMNGSVDLGIIIFNDTPGCPPYPFATRGALGARGVPQWLWMPESWFVTGPAIMSHEIGHMFGGNHPVALRCTNFDDQQTCVAVEAADRHIMTAGGGYQLMPSTYERRRWGWHPPGAMAVGFMDPVSIYDLFSGDNARIKDGPRRGRFYFRHLSGARSGWDIFPEARRNLGIFEYYAGADAAYRQGIAVRIGYSNYADPDALTVLLDPNDTAHFDDSPLRLGQQITIGGVTITCLREQGPALGTRMSVH